MHIDLAAFEPVDTTPVGRRILEAASELFRDHGITATGVDSIVERAATTKRTLYQRYGSKGRLVACYLQQRAHFWQRELLTALTGASPVQALEVVYRHTVQWATATPRGCAFVNAWVEIGANDHEATELIRAEKAWMLTLFTQIAGGDGNTGTILHLLYEGAQVTTSIQGDPRELAQACAASQELLNRQ
ncbi:transcriptional regulator, TetR family [Brevibacterium mcbrellneri ATCC 49030]|uniref:Transcriptional regulator, TetR family n=1 Tax=Brevibacterium mcbrellneri ATCC 49030 TaxID=585530 RepID=D4YML1_9MICO|nr:TetR/AcrR family transcriptional regulator [Brevibacterium mcbrellneri]EFG47529.1 transcriptional regulator, TetR family [Brevibacterium mcbrellneri ATCC 49030]